MGPQIARNRGSVAGVQGVELESPEKILVGFEQCWWQGWGAGHRAECSCMKWHEPDVKVRIEVWVLAV